MNIMRHISDVGSDLLPVSKCPFDNHIMNMSIRFETIDVLQYESKSAILR